MSQDVKQLWTKNNSSKNKNKEKERKGKDPAAM